MKSFLLASAIALSLAHPASARLPNPLTPFTPPSSPQTSLQTITVDDLKNALADSNAQTALPVGVTQPTPYNATVTGGDIRHGNCWASLIDFVGKFQAQNILPSHLGLALAQQKIFDAQQLAGKPLIPDYVVTNCALTFNDAQMNLLQITTALGLKAIAIPKF